MGDSAAVFCFVIPQKFSGTVNLNQLVIINAKFTCFTGAGALLRHALFKTGFINADVAFAHDVGCQIGRETVSVIQFKHGCTRQRIARF